MQHGDHCEVAAPHRGRSVTGMQQGGDLLLGQRLWQTGQSAVRDRRDRVSERDREDLLIVQETKKRTQRARRHLRRLPRHPRQTRGQEPHHVASGPPLPSWPSSSALPLVPGRRGCVSARFPFNPGSVSRGSAHRSGYCRYPLTTLLPSIRSPIHPPTRKPKASATDKCCQIALLTIRGVWRACRWTFPSEQAPPLAPRPC